MKTFKNVSLKKGLLLLTAGAFIAFCMFNVKLGLSDYDKTSIVSFTMEALTSESNAVSCLVNGNQLTKNRSKYSSEMGSSVYCYKKKAIGPDLYQGKIEGCMPVSYTSYCKPSSCSGNGCYVSNQAPASDNY
jgi:hypothetical protein